MLPQANFRKICIMILALLCLLLRLKTLDALAITDPSEGRYATIAAEMYRSGDWVTPQTYKDGERTPFLGKPPLQFWLTAGAYSMLGVTEVASRLPSFLACTAIMLITFILVWEFSASLEIAMSAALLLFSFALVCISSGLCLTDPVLAAATTGALAAFGRWSRAPKQSAFWGRLFFACLALGMLAKGPVAVVLCGLTILPWLIWEKKISILRMLPWLSGGALFMVICAPWFIAAELASPGFIRYFFINENLLRFLVKDYGDRYGNGHQHFRGFIWLLLLIGMLPWTLTLPVLWKGRHADSEAPVASRSLFRFAVCWALAPVFFFTLARQVSPSYVLPGMPGVAIVLAVLFDRLKTELAATFARAVVRGTWFVLVVSAFFAVAGVALHSSPVSCLACLLVAGALFFGLRSGLACDLHSATQLCCCSLIVMFSVVVASLGETLSDALSTREAIEFLDHNKEWRPQEAAFYDKIPNSAYFYTEDEPGDTLTLRLVQSRDEIPRDVQCIIASGNKAQRLAARGFTDKYNRSFGDWRVLSRE